MRTRAFTDPVITRAFIGLDRVFDMIDQAVGTVDAGGFPPHDLEKVGENGYRITMALAGYEPGELDVKVENGVLEISGDRKEKEPEPGTTVIHRGIANRSFTRRFRLADFVEVTGAEFTNGLLTVSLVREIPEARKPRSVAIRTAAASSESTAAASSESEEGARD